MPLEQLLVRPGLRMCRLQVVRPPWVKRLPPLRGLRTTSVTVLPPPPLLFSPRISIPPPVRPETRINLTLKHLIRTVLRTVTANPSSDTHAHTHTQ